MSGRRSAPAGPSIALVVAAVLVALLIAALGARAMLGMLSWMRAGGGASSPDPQFAPQEAAVTRPPELDGELGTPQPLGDPSAGWDLGEQTPVDKTAEELAREAIEERW